MLISTVQVYAQDISWNNMSIAEKNKRVEKIISNTKQNDTTVKEFTEISSVVASTNSTATVSFTNALNGKSEAEVKAIIKNFNAGAANNTKTGLCTSPVTYLRNTYGKKTDNYTVVANITLKNVAKGLTKKFFW